MPSLVPSPKSTKSLANQSEAANPNQGLPCVFERHLLLKRIAKGGMGEVFLATAAGAIDGAERPCVVKVIREEHAEDSSFLARFLDEARIQSQLEHPGVVRVVNASHDEQGKPYVVLEHVEGRNLSEVRLRVQQLGIRLAWPDAVAMALGLTDALAHIHERTDAMGRPLEIVHRDLSPQNVMVAYGGDVKLIDFGTARGQNRKCHTVSGIVFAKPGYVAPEVANNQPGGIPADIYAVGIMLWEMLASRRFIAGDAAEHLVQVAAGTKVIGPIAEAVEAPPELDLICQRLTATKLEDRYESAREASNDLVQLLKRAPSAADGQRSVRVRISQLMQRLYPAEPTRTRAEFQRLVAAARSIEPPASAMVPPPSPPPPPVADSDIKLLLGTRYELGELIGEGTSGKVFEAIHVDLSRKVAVKLFQVEGKVSQSKLASFRREARIAAQLSHENIVRVEDFGTTQDGQVYLAMELLTGQSLDKHLVQCGALEYRSALLLALQVCRALEAAHEAGIVHGDLKPQNLFLTRKGTIKLLDFGVSALYSNAAPETGIPISELQLELGSNASAVTSSSSNPEEALSLVGTVEYLAPEQIRGFASTVATDQYALGVVLYEMLTGTRPHHADSMAALFGEKLEGKIAPPSELVPTSRLPKAVDKLCRKLLAPQSSERFPELREVSCAIEAILDESAIGRKQPGRGMRYAAASSMLMLGALTTLVSSADIRHKAVAFAAHGEQAVRSTLQTQSIPNLKSSTTSVMRAIGFAVTALNQAITKETAERFASAKTQPAVQEPAQAEAALASKSDAVNVAARQETTQAKPEMYDTKVATSSHAPLSPIEQALANDKAGKALVLARKLVDDGNRQPELYRLWVEAATRTRAFGEAHRAMVRLSQLQPTDENAIRLAAMERKLGRNEAAKRTLERLLTKSPKNPEARAMLARLDGSDKVAVR